VELIQYDILNFFVVLIEFSIFIEKHFSVVLYLKLSIQTTTHHSLSFPITQHIKIFFKIRCGKDEW